MKRLTRNDVQINVYVTEEQYDFRSEYCDEVADGIQTMIDRYGLWGYCQVEVRVSWQGIEANDFLGACSYESEKDFIDCGDYYDDMVLTAIDNLNKEVKEMADLCSKRMEIKDLISILRDRFSEMESTEATKKAIRLTFDIDDLFRS